MMLLAIATLQRQFIFSVQPLLLELGCEQTYPLNQSFYLGLQY
ncbi:unnamed protein product [Paramecium octaurelia]|uniref:Uncharacterized protein n=1 Tax=Paramecium octaurelia TaxID=43137 RepID=A0A8S1VTN3_PAROT|nr:unnamed protein product [Paramecium octaurelia]